MVETFAMVVVVTLGVVFGVTFAAVFVAMAVKIWRDLFRGR